MKNRMWSEKVFSESIGKAEETVRGWRKQGIGPPYLKIGGTTIYDPVDVSEWLRKNRVEPKG